MSLRNAVLLCTSVLVLTAGCSGDSDLDTPPAPVPGVPHTKFDLANGCFALLSSASGKYVTLASGNYSANAGSLAQAEPLFLKPTALGKYLLQARDGTLMAAGAGAVGSAATPAESCDWTVDSDIVENFRLRSASASKSLALAGDGALTLGDAAAPFAMVPTTGCTPFPEAPLNVTGKTFAGRGVDQPVLGFADVHQHISATSFLGGGHYGTPFHRFGITQALGNCAAVHGDSGQFDLIGNFLGGSPVSTHDTQGWPTFVDWPAAHSLMHENMYYRWVQRTYMAGLRLMMTNVVENQTLCQLERLAPGQNPTLDCNEMNSAVRQVAFLHELQDYVDAQEGGPGKGWFRIVTTPAQARAVINDGKLAVVLGVEISHLFNCTLAQPAGIEIDGCTQSDIDTQLNRLYDLGIREMFPVHEFDNALGGNGIFDGLVLNAGNQADTFKFWNTYDCPTDDPTGNYADYFYAPPGAIMTTSDPTGATNPLLAALLAVHGGVLPLYPNTRQCNVRGLTDLGRYAIRKMMDRRIVIDLDHLSLKAKAELVDLADAETPVYPLASTHGGFEGLTMDEARRIMAGGGIIYPSNGNGRQFSDQVERLRPLAPAGRLFAMGFGADTNGLATQASPRGADAVPVSYPFMLFRGAGWGSQFAALAPVTFDRETTGERVWDVNVEGWANYGQVADFVEEVRIEGGQPALDALFNSAEVYLQMWERTLNR
jgi:hypothetical protein